MGTRRHEVLRSNPVSRAPSNRNAPVWVSALLFLVGIVAFVIAVIYLADTAGKLPSFLPGHAAGSTHHHTKHALVAAAFGIVAFIGAWLSSGKKAVR
jgi:hypothetical protein